MAKSLLMNLKLNLMILIMKTLSKQKKTALSCCSFKLGLCYLLLSFMMPIYLAYADELSGDLKLFHTMSGAPRGLDHLPSTTSGALSSRLKFKQRWGSLQLEAHGLMSAFEASSNSMSVFSLSPNLSTQSEALPLSYALVQDQGSQLLLRGDRLALSYEWSQYKLTLGRQVISFGQGRAFTPLDRVNPFSPATIDREYKPGVDALRLDGYGGIAGEWTLVVAQRTEIKDSWSLDQSIFAAKIKDSLATWDIALLTLAIQGDLVFGLSLAGPLAELNVYGDFSYTRRAQKGERADYDQTLSLDPDFIRACAGFDWLWSIGGGGRINVEFAWLEDGAGKVDDYLRSASDPRVLSGERWLLAQSYASFSMQQALTPLLNASVSSIINLKDTSALLGPSLAWSISDEASAVIGSYLGVGKGINELTLQSELGTLSWLSFVMLSAYY